MALVRATPQFLVGTGGVPELGFEFGGSKVPLTVTADFSAHELAADPHAQYVQSATLADENAGLRIFPAPRVLSRGIALLEPPVSGVSITQSGSCTINTSQAETLNGETVWRVTATSVGSGQYFDINFPTHPGFSTTDLLFEVAIEDTTKVASIWPYLGTTGYARYISANSGTISPPTVTMSPKTPGMTAYHFTASTMVKGGGVTEIGDEIFTIGRLRFNMVADSVATVRLRSVVVGARGAGRIAIISDDGYASWINRGVPILAEYGFVSTCAVIPTVVGGTGFATLAELQRYVAAGNECVAHGPSTPTANGSLFSAWATDAERLADMISARDYLVANGLTSAAGAKCYVWPQGEFAASTSDFTFAKKAIDAGFSIGRGITANFLSGHKVAAISANNPYRMALTIVGHTFTSAGTEAANIAAIIAKIQTAAADGMDCILKLHKVAGVDDAAVSLEISSNRLRELCAAIKTLVAAGSMSVVRFSDLMV